MLTSRRPFYAFASLAMAVALAVVSAVHDAGLFLFGYVSRAADHVVNAFAAPRLTEPTKEHGAQKAQACAYAMGVAKRERPHVRSQWRMCPSV